MGVARHSSPTVYIDFIGIGEIFTNKRWGREGSILAFYTKWMQSVEEKFAFL